MNISWLPYWTTLLALGCGLAGVLYPKLPSASQGPKPHNFQEKHVKDIASVIAIGLFVLSLTALGILDAIFLAIGWSRSPWAWSAVGVFSLLWIVGRLGQWWRRLPDPKGAPRPADSEHRESVSETTKISGHTDGSGSAH